MVEEEQLSSVSPFFFFYVFIVLFSSFADKAISCIRFTIYVAQRYGR